jgi:hypothetical protein
VVAVLSFSDPTTEEVTRGYARMLKSLVQVSHSQNRLRGAGAAIMRRSRTRAASLTHVLTRLPFLSTTIPSPYPLLPRNQTDGLTVADADLRLAQYDAVNSLKQRRSEVWLELSEHPW